MTWFKVDDKSAFHEKVIAAGDAAWGLFCRAGAWSSGHATDGLVPSQIARTLCPLRSRWDALVAADLVYRSADGYVIRGFLKWNPSAEEVAKKRESRAIAGRNGGISSGHARSKREAIASPTVEAPCFNKNEPPSRPVPSRPRSEPPVCPPTPEPAAVAAPGPVGPDTSDARKVFEAYVECWREHVGRGATPVLTDKRRKAIRARIAEHGLKAVECAARGIWASEWHRENGQTSLDLAMRDAAHVERFALLVAPPAERAPWVAPEPTPPPMPFRVVDPDGPVITNLADLLKLASGQ